MAHFARERELGHGVPGLGGGAGVSLEGGREVAGWKGGGGGKGGKGGGTGGTYGDEGNHVRAAWESSDRPMHQVEVEIG